MDSEQPVGGPVSGPGAGRTAGAAGADPAADRWADGLPEQHQVAVDRFPGPHAGELVLRDLAAATHAYADTLHRDPPPLDPPELQWRLAADAALARRGVRVRAVYPRASLHEPALARFLQALSDAGVTVRVIDHVAHDLLIFDRHTVCLPSHDRPVRQDARRRAAAPAAPGHVPRTSVPRPTALPGPAPGYPAPQPADPDEPSLLRIQGDALVRSFTAIHESYWQRATPLPLAGAGLRHAPLGALERAVIRLMTNGYGDDRIARKLGIERHEVEDVMAALMERLGAGSRFEVGYKLARALDPSELSPGRG
ncbi:helix-turn-helix transcriptional regulator [Actinacidiphila sp. bgisy144]|uniref:helix-turn-helix transcriptional regulator n=1 Tax=unclassified Actinacidiphila TaxID=2995708 RepID=UPI003EB7E226